MFLCLEVRPCSSIVSWLRAIRSQRNVCLYTMGSSIPKHCAHVRGVDNLLSYFPCCKFLEDFNLQARDCHLYENIKFLPLLLSHPSWDFPLALGGVSLSPGETMLGCVPGAVEGSPVGSCPAAESTGVGVIHALTVSWLYPLLDEIQNSPGVFS